MGSANFGSARRRDVIVGSWDFFVFGFFNAAAFVAALVVGALDTL